MPEFEVRNRDSLGTAAKDNTYEMMRNQGLKPQADLSLKDSTSNLNKASEILENTEGSFRGETFMQKVPA